MARHRIPVTPAVIQSLAAAARLSLTLERHRELVSHLEAFMAEVTRLDEVDVSGYEPPIPVAVPPRRPAEGPR